MKVKIKDKIINTYSVIYVIILHITAIWIVAYPLFDFTQNTADIILQSLGITLFFTILSIGSIVPALLLFLAGTVVSFFMFISLPLFLFLALFQILGAESINVLEYGFIKTIIFCIVITPFGIMNLLAFKNIFDEYI